MVVLAVLLAGSPAWGDGDFYVIGGGGGVGTKITSLPFPINSPGFYYLTKDLDFSGSGNGIDVNVDDVTIDLMGFRLRDTASGFAGIHLNAHKNVEIRNGTFSGWTVAITDGSTSAARNRAFNIRVENGSYGVEFMGTGNLIKGCTSETTMTGLYCNGGVVSGNAVRNNTYGLVVNRATVSGNSAENCSNSGIYCSGPSTIIHNTVVTTATGQIGFRILTGDPVLVMQNTASGPGTRLSPGAGTVVVTNAGF
jgi:hypothetical protein